MSQYRENNEEPLKSLANLHYNIRTTDAYAAYLDFVYIMRYAAVA